MKKSDLSERLWLNRKGVDAFHEWRSSGAKPAALEALREDSADDARELLALLRKYRRETDAYDEALAREQQAIAEQRAEYSALRDWIDAQARDLLMRHGDGATKKLVIDGRPYALRRSTRVEIDERFPVELLPPEFVRETTPATKRAPDKKAIKKAIHDGRRVGFARLTEKRTVVW